jgi:hypothetical protein
MLTLSLLVARLRARTRRPAAERPSDRDWADLPVYHPRQD